MAPSDAVRAAWALFLGLNQRVPRATATDALRSKKIQMWPLLVLAKPLRMSGAAARLSFPAVH